MESPIKGIVSPCSFSDGSYPWADEPGMPDWHTWEPWPSSRPTWEPWPSSRPTLATALSSSEVPAGCRAISNEASVICVVEIVAGVGGLCQGVSQVPGLGQSINQCVHHCVEDGH